MDIRLDDGTIIRGVPDGMTKAELTARLARNGFSVPAAAPTGPVESDAFKAGRASDLRGLYSVLQGPTFGFADEIGGLIGGIKSKVTGGDFSTGYKDTRDMMRGAAAEEETANPWTTRITRGMASLPTMLMNPLGAATGAGIGGRMLNAAGTGGIFGALSGAGESTAEDLSGVGLDALKGGATGAAVGGALVPVAQATGAGARNVAARFNESAASQYAREKLAQAFARDARGTVAQDSGEAALRQALARFDKLGPEARAVDAGGQNTRQLLDTLATLPGQTKEATEAAIRSRQAGRAGRLIGAAESGLNPSGLRLTETVDDLVARRAEAAGPLYTKLHQRNVPMDDELRGLITAAGELGAAGTAKKLAIARQQPFTLDPTNRVAAFRDLDHLKQGLDDVIQANIDQFGKMNKTGAAVSELKDKLISKLDTATGGAYKQARDAFAGPSALIEAANNGRKVWSLDDQGIAKTMRNMSESEAEAFRLGAAEALRSKMGRQGGQTEVLNMWREPATRDKLKAIFGTEREFRQFAVAAAQESRLKGIESVGRGSQTAARQYGAGDLDTAAVQDVSQMIGGASHGNLPAFLSAAGSAWNRVKTPEPVRDAMGGLLLSQGQQGRQGLLSLDDTLRRLQANRSAQAGAFGVGGGLLGPLVY